MTSATATSPTFARVSIRFPPAAFPDPMSAEPPGAIGYCWATRWWLGVDGIWQFLAQPLGSVRTLKVESLTQLTQDHRSTGWSQLKRVPPSVESVRFPETGRIQI